MNAAVVGAFASARRRRRRLPEQETRPASLLYVAALTGRQEWWAVSVTQGAVLPLTLQDSALGWE